MKKTFVLLFFLIAAAGTLFAQSKKKKNPFEMVHVDDSVRNNYKFVEGCIHFIYTEKEGVEIIAAYDLEGLLTQVVSCFKRNLDRFDETERIACIEKTIHDLDDRPNSYGA